MSKSTSMTLLLGLVLLGAYIVSKVKKDALNGVDVILPQSTSSVVNVPDGFHLMPDGSLMANEEHGATQETYQFGGENWAVSF
jgi:hypothetical protein